jgi:hypothetical protein
MKTIPDDQIGMVICGLRLLQDAIETATLDEEDAAIITGDGGAFPTSEEISTLMVTLELPEAGQEKD